MAKDFKDLGLADPDALTRDQAMIYVLNFFNSRMSAVNKASVSRAKHLVSRNEIAVSELIDLYVRLVHENS